MLHLFLAVSYRRTLYFIIILLTALKLSVDIEQTNPILYEISPVHYLITSIPIIAHTIFSLVLRY